MTGRLIGMPEMLTEAGISAGGAAMI